MYQENQFKTFNIWRDQDVIHVFLSVPSKKYSQYTKTMVFLQRKIFRYVRSLRQS